MENIMKKNFEMLYSGKIPESYIGMSESIDIKLHEHFLNREKYIDSFGFVLVAKDWVKIISKLIGTRGTRCLEVMAGTGLLSKALIDCGVNMITTDNLSWENEHQYAWKQHWCDIEQLDAVSSIKKYGKNVNYIIMSFPYMDETATYCLHTMRKVNPQCKLIFIGEGVGGCTASDSFFAQAKKIENEILSKANDKYCRFPYMHDKIYLFA